MKNNGADSGKKAETDAQAGALPLSDFSLNTSTLNITQTTSPAAPRMATANAPVTITQVIDNIGKTGTVTHNSTIDDPRPMFLGRAGANQLVTLYDHLGEALGSAYADAAGHWRIQPEFDLPEGPQGITAETATRWSAGFQFNYKPAADFPLEITFVEDHVGDYAKHYNSIHQLKMVDDPRPPVSGRAGVGELVTVYANTQAGKVLIGSAVADEEGRWTVTPLADMSNGHQQLVAETASKQSAGFTLVVNVPQPAPVQDEQPADNTPTLMARSAPAADAPVSITQVFDNVGKTGAAGNRDNIDDPRPVFSGRAGANQLVTLYNVAYEAIGSAVADRHGNWTIQPDVDLVKGLESYTAETATQWSTGIWLNYIPAADAVLAITQVDDGTGGFNNSDTFKISGAARPTISGVAGVGEIVNVYANSQAGKMLIGSAVAGHDGRWILTPEVDIANGHVQLVAETASKQSAGFTLAVNAPEAAEENNLLIINDYAWDDVSRPGFIGNAGAAESYSGADRTDDTRPTFDGSAAPGERVTLYSGDVVLGSVIADNDGWWELEITTPLRQGVVHNVVAKTETHTSNEFVINIDNPGYAAVNISRAFDNVNKQGAISQGKETDDARPTFSGTAGANEVVTLYSGDQVLGSTLANSNGSWTLEIDESLDNGTHLVRAMTEHNTSNAVNINVQAPEPTFSRSLARGFDMVDDSLLVAGDTPLFDETIDAESADLPLALNTVDWLVSSENGVMANLGAASDSLKVEEEMNTLTF